LKIKNIVTFLMVAVLAACSEEGHDVVPLGSVQFRSTLVDDSGMSGSLATAEISLWADGRRYRTNADANGEYSLEVPLDALPRSGQISMSVYKPGYRVVTALYSAPLQEGTTYTLSDTNRMQTCADCVSFDFSSSHQLWHIGDDSFSGSVNSQFQKRSDTSDRLVFPFIVPADKTQLKVSFWAKGVQSSDTGNLPSQIWLSDDVNLLGTFDIYDSPESGAYRYYEYDFTIPSSSEFYLGMIAGTAQSQNGDIDDWEFNGLNIEAF